ncbi:MAG: anti-sigma factor family protein [bacterium]
MKTFFHHRRLQRLLVLYADGELREHESAPIRRHLESCAACRQRLADIRGCRELLKMGQTPSFIPAEQLWRRIAGKIAASPPERFALRKISFFAGSHYLRWSLAAAALLLLSVAVWKRTNLGETAAITGARAIIDYGIFLDDVRQEAAEGNFYKRYPAQVVQLVEAQQEIAFPLAAIEALPDSFRLDCVRVLECNGKKCVQFTCVKAGKVINIFQHALGQPWTLGQFAVARAPICNVECLMMSTKNITAVSWKGNHSEYLTIGDLTSQELAQFVQVLQ